jgi:hypothetical protein
MSIGTIGNIRPSDVNVDDIEVIYTFSPDRTTPPQIIDKIIDTGDIISEVNIDNNLVQGLYNIKLDPNVFNEIGIYNIYIKPKEYIIDISDCGVLATISSVRGIVIDSNKIPELSNRFNSNGLAGFKIEYIDDNGDKIRNLFRIITSSNRAIVEGGNNTSPTQSSVRYRFSDSESSNLLFLTVSPSSPNNLRPNVNPFLGIPGQNIILSNTFFNPVLIEIEMTEHDIETLALGIYGNQSKSKVDGILTYYDKDSNIYKQFDVFETENSEGLIDYEVKLERDSIDPSKDLNNVLSDVE